MKIQSFVLVLASVFAIALGSCGDGVNYDYCGGACYAKDQYVCYQNKTMCPIKAPSLCGTNACYNEEQYQCCHGLYLGQQGQTCPPIPECCGASGPLRGEPQQRETCYQFIDSDGFKTNPGTGEPLFYYRPCSNPDLGKLGCTGAPALEAAGCRMCGLDPVNDIRCEKNRKRSGADFQCPCEVIDWMKENNMTDKLPAIYRVDPVCDLPDCEEPENPGSCDSNCGEGACYSSDQYVCNEGQYLCPLSSPASCGKACYNPDFYTCCPGNFLVSGKDVECIGEIVPEQGCCPASGVILDDEESRHKCYSYINKGEFPVNPTTGEPYFSYRPCTPDGDRTLCVGGNIEADGCRMCSLDPVNDIRCPSKKRSLPGYSCPCDMITYLFEKDPSLLPAIYRAPPACEDDLELVCLTDDLYGAAIQYKLAHDNAGYTLYYSLALMISTLFFALFN